MAEVEPTRGPGQAAPHAPGGSSAFLSQLEEVVRLKKTIDKAIPSPVSPGANDGDAGPESVTRVVEALDVLEGIQVTRALLAKSRIGVSVGNLRRHSNATIRSKSASLVARWKGIINSEKQRDGKAQTTPSGGTDSSKGTVSDASRGTDATPKAAQTNGTTQDGAGSGASATGEARYPGPFTGNSTRDKARTFLWKALVDGLGPSAPGNATTAETGRVAASIEDALWTKFVVEEQSNRDYNSQLKTLKWNLADPKNPDLNLKVLWGMYTAQQLAVMTSAELASDEKKREREQQKQESMEACQSDWEVRRIMNSGEANQGQFPCFKCKTNKTVYFQMQTRSSDEPMTTFVTCLECGNRWKF